MVTITSKRVRVDDSVGLDFEIEFYLSSTFTDSQEFSSKDQANKYFSSTMLTVLSYNIEALLRESREKDSSEYKTFRDSYGWCINMAVDHKTLIDVVKNNIEQIRLISRDNLPCQEIAEKIIKFCTT